MRAKQREVWVERMLRTLPIKQRTAAVHTSVARLVDVDVWNRSGASFEFAHFSDRQIAVAIDGLDRRGRAGRGSKTWLGSSTSCACAGAIFKNVLHGTSKPDLADVLWPVLERKIQKALERGTERRVPVVRVVDRAVTLARGMPRRNVVIPIEDP